VVLVSACRLLKLLVSCEFFETDRARALRGVTLLHPHFLRNSRYLFWFQSFRDLPVSLLQLTNLFVSHFIHVRTRWVVVCGLALLDSPLQQPLLLCLGAVRTSKHTVHHDLHHNLSLSLPVLLLLHLHCQLYLLHRLLALLCCLFTTCSCTSTCSWPLSLPLLFFFGVLGLILEFHYSGPKIEVLLAQACYFPLLRFNLTVFLLDYLKS
jgi:hypothetical protein